MILALYFSVGTCLLGALVWTAKQRGEEHRFNHPRFRIIVLGACLLWPLTALWALTTREGDPT